MPSDIPLLHDASSAEFGYIIGSQYAGRGYATESTNGVLQLAVDLGFCTAIAYVTAGNDASCQILRKCGFSYACSETAMVVIDGKTFDDLMHLQKLSV